MTVASIAGPLMARVAGGWPGLAATLTVAAAATFLSEHYGAPAMLFALLLGMAFHFLHEEGRCIAGIEIAASTVLRLGVALLGVRISTSQILELGLAPLATVVAGVASTIGLGVLASRVFGQSRSFGLLSGGAVGICGASAALAIAAVLPRGDERDRETILTVVTVTAFSTIAMIAYPMIAAALRLDTNGAGLFLGGTIHDVAQVVGAGYSVSPHAGDVATYVKLLRVALLLPVVFVVALVVARRPGRPGATQAPTAIPWFLLGFAALVAANSLGFISRPVGDAAGEASRWCLIAAIAALGMKTSFKVLAVVGWRPVALIALETAWIAGLVLVVVKASA